MLKLSSEDPLEEELSHILSLERIEQLSRKDLYKSNKSKYDSLFDKASRYIEKSNPMREMKRQRKELSHLLSITMPHSHKREQHIIQIQESLKALEYEYKKNLKIVFNIRSLDENYLEKQRLKTLTPRRISEEVQKEQAKLAELEADKIFKEDQKRKTVKYHNVGQGPSLKIPQVLSSIKKGGRRKHNKTRRVRK